jgi:hypothetical protein
LLNTGEGGTVAVSVIDRPGLADLGSEEPVNGSQSIAKRVERLSDLVWSALPGTQVAPVTNVERWQRLIAPAMLAKATTTLESMDRLMIDTRWVDSLVLLRAMYENVVNLAWVAVNPTHRVNRLYTEFQDWHLREHEDWAKAGRPLLSREEVNESQAWLDAHKTGLPHVADRARNADRYWGARLAGWHPEASNASDVRSWSSLRGLYRFIYPRGSQATHSHHRGLDPFVTVADDGCTAHQEEVPESDVVWELGVRLLLFAIGPAESTIGWPSYVEARRIVGDESEHPEDTVGLSPV